MARYANPLPGLIVEKIGTFENESRDVRRKNFRFVDANFDAISTDANEFVDEEENGGKSEVEIEERRLNESSAPVKNEKTVEKNIELVRGPEELESVTSSIRDSEYVHGCHDESHENSGDAS